MLRKILATVGLFAAAAPSFITKATGTEISAATAAKFMDHALNVSSTGRIEPTSTDEHHQLVMVVGIPLMVATILFMACYMGCGLHKIRKEDRKEELENHDDKGIPLLKSSHTV